MTPSVPEAPSWRGSGHRRPRLRKPERRLSACLPPVLYGGCAANLATLSTFTITKLRKSLIRLDLRKMDQAQQSEPARSRDRILGLLLRSEEPLSVQALAARLSISRHAAHQQVAALEREGLIERDSAIRTRGRPSQGYRLSNAGSATFPRQYALIARQLLAELAKHLGPDELRGALQRIGASLAESLAVEDGEIASVAGLMRQLGY